MSEPTVFHSIKQPNILGIVQNTQLMLTSYKNLFQAACLEGHKAFNDLTEACDWSQSVTWPDGRERQMFVNQKLMAARRAPIGTAETREYFAGRAGRR